MLDNQKINCEIINVSSSKSLPDIARKVAPDIVIIDFDFYFHDPAAIVKKLRKFNSEAYILAFVDPNHYEKLHLAIELGIDDYMVKPLLRDDVMLRIKMGIQRKLARFNSPVKEKTADVKDKDVLYRAEENLSKLYAVKAEAPTAPEKREIAGEQQEEKLPLDLQTFSGESIYFTETDMEKELSEAAFSPDVTFIDTENPIKGPDAEIAASSVESSFDDEDLEELFGIESENLSDHENAEWNPGENEESRESLCSEGFDLSEPVLQDREESDELFDPVTLHSEMDSVEESIVEIESSEEGIVEVGRDEEGIAEVVNDEGNTVADETDEEVMVEETAEETAGENSSYSSDDFFSQWPDLAEPGSISDETMEEGLTVPDSYEAASNPASEVKDEPESSDQFQEKISPEPEDNELFGMQQALKTVDTSSFEELFSKERECRTSYLEDYKAKKAGANREGDVKSANTRGKRLKKTVGSLFSL
jgi:DNA-binding NarL/FixJ family response regulator